MPECSKCKCRELCHYLVYRANGISCMTLRGLVEKAIEEDKKGVDK